MQRADHPLIVLKPGELYATERPVLVTTVLGSCISVTMFCRTRRAGAICHALLPSSAGRDDGNEFRYVDTSISAMLRRFSAWGIGQWELEIKVFGGSDMLASVEGSGHGVGRQNIEMALRVIEAERLALIASDLGGNRGRKLFFKPHTGEVLVKRLARNYSENY